ncbi:hypothetical protein D0C28_10795 [Rhizobium sp. AU243]|nr:hypothetical protein D0C28_10795 [Rhizobium sp. AU243]
MTNAYAGVHLRRPLRMRDNRNVKRKIFRAEGLKLRIRGKDNAPLTMSDHRQGLFELMRRLQPYHAYLINTFTSSSMNAQSQAKQS